MISKQAPRQTGEPAALNARELLQRQFWVAHALLDAAIDTFPNPPPRRRPQYGAAAIVRYAQTVLCEDLTVNGVLAAGVPLALSTWAGRTGLSELPPLAGCDVARAPAWTAWAREVRIDGPKMRAYARAVYRSTDASIAALPVNAFDPARRRSPACVLTALLLTVSMRRGELACLATFTFDRAERRPCGPKNDDAAGLYAPWNSRPRSLGPSQRAGVQGAPLAWQAPCAHRKGHSTKGWFSII